MKYFYQHKETIIAIIGIVIDATALVVLMILMIVTAATIHKW
jgi:hypothetical protein